MDESPACLCCTIPIPFVLGAYGTFLGAVLYLPDVNKWPLIPKLYELTASAGATASFAVSLAGLRVLEFVVEGKVDNRWRTIGKGTAIGHKRILAVEPKLYQAIRFKATKAQGEPQIRQLAAFQTNSEPPKDWNK